MNAEDLGLISFGEQIRQSGSKSVQWTNNMMSGRNQGFITFWTQTPQNLPQNGPKSNQRRNNIMIGRDLGLTPFWTPTPQSGPKIQEVINGEKNIHDYFLDAD